MSYKVKIINNLTKEERLCLLDLDWNDWSLFSWTEGNYGCDCNREMVFRNAKNEESESEPECGNKKYTVELVILEDGTEIYID